MSLPPIVSEYLFQLDSGLRRSICFVFDDDYHVREWWGSVNQLGDTTINVGSDIREIVPAVFGLDLNKELRLEFVGLGKDLVFSLHLFHQQDSHYVLLIPPTRQKLRQLNCNK